MDNQRAVAHEMREVYFGNRVRTAAGLKRNDLIRTKKGKIISKKQYLHGKRMYQRMQRQHRHHAHMFTK